MLKLLFVFLVAVALPLGCSAEAGDPEIHDHSHVHAVKCGCAIAGIDKCGNYIEIDGKFVPLAGEIGLGKMEFCKKNGLMAEVEGSIVDGKFVATSFAYHEH